MKNLSLTFCLVIAALFASVGSGFASSHLKKCPETGYLNNCFVDFSTIGGGKWTGNVKSGILIAHSSNGNTYRGGFKNKKFNGQGTYIWADGEKYVGEWKNNKKYGHGTLTWGPNSEWAGDKYVGEFKDDKPNGQGVRTYADGTVKEGIWKNGEFQYAKEISPSVPVAKTPTQDDEIISASSGNGFASDLPDCPKYRHPTNFPWHNCFGTFPQEWLTGGPTGVSGDKYVGEFKHNKEHGQGTFTFGQFSHFAGLKYVGEWKRGKRNGQGSFTYQNGNQYVGEFKNDVMNGKGTYIWVNGDKYVGEFKDGYFNGQGTKTYTNGTVKEGVWENDQFIGK